MKIRQIVLFIHLSFLSFILVSQNDPKLDSAFRQLKKSYIDFDNHAVPFKENNKWGLLSSEDSILHQASLDSIMVFSKNVMIGKEGEIYKLIDCNGNVVFNKVFKDLKIINSIPLSLVAVDTNKNSCKVRAVRGSDSNFYIELLINPEKQKLDGDSSSFIIKSEREVRYYNINPLKNYIVYFSYDTLNSRIEVYNQGKLDHNKTYSRAGNTFDLHGKMFIIPLNSSSVQCFIYSTGKSLFYENLESAICLSARGKDYFVMTDKKEIRIIDEEGLFINSIPNIYSEINEVNGNIILKSDRTAKKNITYLNLLNWEVDTSYYVNIFPLFDYVIVQNEESVYTVLNSSYQEIYIDTIIKDEYYHINDKSFLIIKTNDAWKIINNEGDVLYSLYNPKLEACIVRDGVIEFGYYRKLDSYELNTQLCGIFTNDSLRLIPIEGIDIINSNCYLIKSKSGKDYYFTDSTLSVLKRFQNVHRIRLEGKGENFAVYVNYLNDSSKSYEHQFNNKLEEIINPNIKLLGVRNITKRFVESPFYLYEENSKKYYYGILDSEGNAVQENEFRVIIAINENFIVIKENFEIGFLDKNGKKLY